MSQYPNRRSFLGGLLFISLSPFIVGKLPKNKTPASSSSYQKLKEVVALDNDYVSINGWVLSKDTLTRGVR